MDTILPPGHALRTAVDHADFRSFAQLAVRYHAWLNVDLQFQDFEHELTSLPGSYAQPAGCILLVSYRSSPDAAPEDVACVAVRPLKKQQKLPKGKNSCNSIAAAAAQTSTMVQRQQQQQQQQDDDAPDTLPSSHTCELKRLWVEQPHQRVGLGRALMAAALQASQRSYPQQLPCIQCIGLASMSNVSK
jgi:GNAT superfamily N-acetyltransferase